MKEEKENKRKRKINQEEEKKPSKIRKTDENSHQVLIDCEETGQFQQVNDASKRTTKQLSAISIPPSQSQAKQDDDIQFSNITFESSRNIKKNEKSEEEKKFITQLNELVSHCET